MSESEWMRIALPLCDNLNGWIVRCFFLLFGIFFSSFPSVHIVLQQCLQALTCANNFSDNSYFFSWCFCFHHYLYQYKHIIWTLLNALQGSVHFWILSVHRASLWQIKFNNGTSNCKKIGLDLLCFYWKTPNFHLQISINLSESLCI